MVMTMILMLLLLETILIFGIAEGQTMFKAVGRPYPYSLYLVGPDNFILCDEVTTLYPARA